MHKLLLHTCCAPCLTIAEEKLRINHGYKDDCLVNNIVDIFWFNPNIYPLTEKVKRYQELVNYCHLINRQIVQPSPPDMADNSDYGNNWKQLIHGLEDEPEGGSRCKTCIFYRLETTAAYAAQLNYDAFSTTLTSSPYKDADLIYRIGCELAKKYNIDFEFYDFKAAGGYRRSIDICRENNIYRQKYCGCQYSIM